MDRVASDLLGIDPADIQDAQDGTPALTATHLFIFERQNDADPDKPSGDPVEAEEGDE